MRIGGVDPAVIRELSGIYKPFVKAVKELVSNSYDADAESVRLVLSDDFSSLTVEDDGVGMTPVEFRRDFTKVGGSYTRLRGEKTKKGRPKIGSKGIGFLAPARYCKKMEVVSSTLRTHQDCFICPIAHKTDLQQILNIPLSPEVINGRFRITEVVACGPDHKKVPRSQYEVKEDGTFIFKRSSYYKKYKELKVTFELHCQDLELRASIDFEYLLSLENRKDLEEITDFCEVQIVPLPKDDPKRGKIYTVVVLQGLKEFVRQDLRSPKKFGNVRNIESRSGIDRFRWELSRCIPVRYDLPKEIREHFGHSLLHHGGIKSIRDVTFSCGPFKNLEIQRPVWDVRQGGPLFLHNDLCVRVDVDEDGLVAKGYLMGLTETIFPAEYRGIAIRVRNVQIGPPTFLSMENVLTGSEKAALSQITGEVNVLRGLDAIDAINPGRESFYEENKHYKILRRILVGEGESAGGFLGQVIQGIQNRSRVISAVKDVFTRADERRGILENISSGVLHYATSSRFSEGLRKMFTRENLSSNGLSKAKDINFFPEHRIGGYLVESTGHIEEEEYKIDFVNERVLLNSNHTRWNWRIILLGEYYEIVNKEGRPDQPICEIDTKAKKVYVNWGHPIRSQMDERSFLKSAITWNIALHASNGDGEAMMNLGLELLAFKG